MKPSRKLNIFNCGHAWALYIRTEANKEGTFENYLKHNSKVKWFEWEMLNKHFVK